VSREELERFFDGLGERDGDGAPEPHPKSFDFAFAHLKQRVRGTKQKNLGPHLRARALSHPRSRFA